MKWGTTAPRSWDEPCDADQVLSKALRDELEAAFPMETAEGMARRQAVLAEIDQRFSQWATGWQQAEGCTKVTTMGSYRLGVVQPASDVDIVCIGPPGVSREAFFDSFVQILDSHEDVTECVPIPEAYTPIVKLKMRGVCIDLLYAQVARPLPPGADLEAHAQDDAVLKHMDERSVRCMNGFRVADQLLALVPNQETFRRTLRFVKHWARQRNVYSNALGFFGGITWSLLVARVCQLYPNYSPSQLVNRFFLFYLQWKWPNPVMLCPVYVPRKSLGLYGLKVWDPTTYPADRQHVMPVITPAFPAMNSTYNVTETTKRILLEEFKRGYEMCRHVQNETAPWSKVYEPHPFLDEYKNFLLLEILARAEDVYKKFSGWVEGKVRILVMQLEALPGMLLHPNPVQYEIHGLDPEWPFGCGMLVAMSFSAAAGAHAGLNFDLNVRVTQFMAVLSSWSCKDDHAGQCKLRLRRVTRSKLPEYITNPQVAQ